MPERGCNFRTYVTAVAIGAIGGGVLVAVATRAMPKMMSRMMQKMMTHMGGEGCSPAEM